MGLFLISIGLAEKEDMSIKAVQTAKKCDVLYLERYTNFYKSTTNEIAEFLRKEVNEVARSDLEEKSKKIVEEAKKKNIGVLVVGDALSATTHNTLLLECMEKNVDYEIIHGSSIFTAVAESGLSLYKFGNATSIPFENENVETPYEVLKKNNGMHTLVLLDLKNGKHMNVKDAAEYFLRVEEKRKEGIFGKEKPCIALFALGSKESEIIACSAKELLAFDKKKLNKAPQCLVIPGMLNFIEEEFMKKIKCRKA